MKLTPEEWDDAADLMEQFMAQCEIAFEDHAPHAKKWCVARLDSLRWLATERGEHPRRRRASVKGTATP